VRMVHFTPNKILRTGVSFTFIFLGGLCPPNSGGRRPPYKNAHL
jgi:hypothetical protein